ncbi:MAG: hypothetical protein JWL77_5196 [Chthonomonadaceae bacterium]|nr:hypothetical protein [Chthonomonadaceae bacterium]
MGVFLMEMSRPSMPWLRRTGTMVETRSVRLAHQDQQMQQFALAGGDVDTGDVLAFHLVARRRERRIFGREMTADVGIVLV